MSTRDRLPSVSIAPGSTVKHQYFNISSAGSMESNIDGEMTRRSEHQTVDFVVTIPTFYDSEFEDGYTASDALEVTRNTSDNAKIDIKPGVAYIGGRRYKQTTTTEEYDLTGSSDATYYIRLRYQKSTQTFDFIAETTETADSDTIKYLTLASASWDQTGSQIWNDDFTDLRATNTQLPAPSTIAGTTSQPILTLNQSSTGNTLKLVGSATGGDAVFFDTTNPKTLTIYGTNSACLTLYEDASSYNVTLVADNTSRLKVLSNLYVPTATQLGSMTFSSTTMAGVTLFDCGASPTFQTSSGDFGWNSENFTSVGSIGCASIDASGEVLGSYLKSDVSIGTQPVQVTSTTLCNNLNADQVDGYDFTGTAGSVTANAAELNNLDGYTGDVTDLNTIIRSGKTKGQILWASASSTLAWLASSDGVLQNSGDVITWEPNPVFTGMTLDGSPGLTFDNTSTDRTIVSDDDGIYFGDTAQVADKDTSPDWYITGAGASKFSSVTIGSTLITATATEINTVADGAFTKNDHTHEDTLWHIGWENVQLTNGAEWDYTQTGPAVKLPAGDSDATIYFNIPNVFGSNTQLHTVWAHSISGQSGYVFDCTLSITEMNMVSVDTFNDAYTDYNYDFTFGGQSWYTYNRNQSLSSLSSGDQLLMCKLSAAASETYDMYIMHIYVSDA